MKSSTFKRPQDEKLALPALRPTKAPAKRPYGLIVHPMLDAWVGRPPCQPENLLHILRNRSN